MDSFGAYLKAQREKKGIRLEEIASITKIHLHSLELLETSKWDQLPPEPFIRGFILAYAKYIGLGTNEVLERYREATGTPEVVETPAAAPIMQPMGRTPRIPTGPSATPGELINQVRLPSGAKMITAASLIAVVGLAVLLINVGRESDNPKTETNAQTSTASPAGTAETASAANAAATPAVSEEGRKVAVNTDAAKVAPTPESAPTPASAAVAGVPAHEVVVEGKERTWIKVVIDEEQPTEYFLSEGKSVTYKALNKIKVVLGNSTGSKVLYNGKEIDGKQFMGTIRTYKFPPNARFPQDVPSKRTTAVSETEPSTGAPPATE